MPGFGSETKDGKKYEKAKLDYQAARLLGEKLRMEKGLSFARILELFSCCLARPKISALGA